MSAGPAGAQAGVRPRAILETLGIRASRLRRIRSGGNTHWIAGGGEHPVVLRLYGSEVSAAEADYELRLLSGLARRGWPVAAPLTPLHRDVAGFWMLFPYLAGRPPTPRTEAGRSRERRRRGRLLAALHASLAELGGAQRPGWRRADEGLFARHGAQRAEGEVVACFARRDPPGGDFLRDQIAILRAELAGRLGDLPAPIPIHGDLTPWNLRYRDGELTGILDFDSAHLDFRIADFALSWRGRDDEVIRGYEEVSPLTAAERELILPMYRGWMVACALDALRQGASPDWALRHLHRVRHARS